MKLKDFYIIRDTSWYEYGQNNELYYRRRIMLFGIQIIKISRQRLNKK